MPADPRQKEFTMDAADLYREDIYTDRRTGSIRRLVPVTADGADDPARSQAFIGEAQLLTPMGVLPLNFEIEAGSLKEAIEKFPAAVKDAVDHAIREANEMRREAASSIVVPGAGGMGPGGLPGLPGGGKIKMP